MTGWYSPDTRIQISDTHIQKADYEDWLTARFEGTVRVVTFM
jgi:hypothetical protein